jgi:hypothetical protein
MADLSWPESARIAESGAGARWAARRGWGAQNCLFWLCLTWQGVKLGLPACGVGFGCDSSIAAASVDLAEFRGLPSAARAAIRAPVQGSAKLYGAAVAGPWSP